MHKHLMKFQLRNCKHNSELQEGISLNRQIILTTRYLKEMQNLKNAFKCLSINFSVIKTFCKKFFRNKMITITSRTVILQNAKLPLMKSLNSNKNFLQLGLEIGPSKISIILLLVMKNMVVRILNKSHNQWVNLKKKWRNMLKYFGHEQSN